LDVVIGEIHNEPRLPLFLGGCLGLLQWLV
jgi:hypothetical protein